LKRELQLDLTNWLKRCLPSRQNQEIYIHTGHHITVPEGAIVTFEFPQDLTRRLIKDIQNRAKES
jgi:hypothetical protein